MSLICPLIGVKSRNYYSYLKRSKTQKYSPDGDITYIWTTEGWLYLAVVIDLYSRKVVGWSMPARMKANLVCDVLLMAIWKRNSP